MCANVCVSESPCVSCVFPLALGFVLFCSVIIIAVLVFLVPLYMRERKDEHLGEWRSEEDLGGVGGGKTVIRI